MICDSDWTPSYLVRVEARSFSVVMVAPNLRDEACCCLIILSEI